MALYLRAYPLEHLVRNEKAASPTAYRVADIARALSVTGVEAGDLVCVHSSLFMLGRPTEVSPRAVPEAVAQILLDYLGPRGTLVVPTFTFGFCRGKPFDRQKTPGEGMGVLSEYVRRMPESYRSPHPIQSIAAVGQWAEALCAPDPRCAFDPGGPFDLMRQHDAKLVRLGQGAVSLIHWAEQQVEVPYRFWKPFTGAYVDEGEPEERTYYMFARDLDIDPRLDFQVVDEALEAQGLLHTASLGSGTVRTCGFREYLEVAEVLLRDDPYCLVQNRSDIVDYCEQTASGDRTHAS